MTEADFAPWAAESLRLADLMAAAAMETWPAWDEVDVHPSSEADPSGKDGCRVDFEVIP
jgi:hypothetical protein